MNHRTFAASLALFGAASAAMAQPPSSTIRFEPFELNTASRGKTASELGRFTVPEDRTQEGGRTIELAFARLKSTSTAPGSPIVYLDGGPGGSGVGAARVPGLDQLFEGLRVVGDVLLLSQRGTGLSVPHLGCASSGLPPADVLSSAAAMTAAFLEKTRACVSEWRTKGVKLQAYNTEESADDLEDLRKALGVPRITLLAFSYGTHLALSMARRHPGSIDRMILAGTEGPDHTQKLPSTFDQQLARIAALEAALPAPPSPGLVEVTHALLQKLALRPVVINVEAPGVPTPIPVPIGREGLAYLIRLDIGDTNDTAMIVKLIRETSAGTYGTLKRLATRRLAHMAGGSNLMGQAMDCGSGASPERAARIKRELPGSVLGVMTNYPFPDICELIGVEPLQGAFRAPLISDLPALFISGTLDSNTPPYQAEEVRWGFTRGTPLIVENAGHESTLPLPEIRRAIIDFLKGIDVGDRRVSLPSPLVVR